jgi:hypothetical protein
MDGTQVLSTYLLVLFSAKKRAGNTAAGSIFKRRFTAVHVLEYKSIDPGYLRRIIFIVLEKLPAVKR